ncbi:MAG: hypothetical protein ABIK09_01800 [Pseudomonadota bacterium]
MKNTIRTLMIGLSLLSLAACVDAVDAPAGTEPEAPAAVAPEPAVAPEVALAAEPLQSLDDNTQVEGPWLFAMETTPELLELTLHGTSQERLAGRLADPDGRREIVFYGGQRAAPLVLFRADWLLPAVGAANRAGEMLVCVNRLVGAPSALTRGPVPDPAGGVDLACRWRATRGWTRELRVPRRDTAALWLNDVVAQKDGSFRVTFSKDSTGLLVDDPTRDEGVYRVRFDSGRFGEPELASRFAQP